MGVDARMFARIRGRDNWLKDENELTAAVEMAQAIGCDHFLITRGGEYKWSQHHALSIVRPLKDTADCDDRGVDANHVGKVVYTQDGDDIVADPDEQFIEVHLWSRYYGEDYARGDWPTIRATAEWLEFRFPGCEVWYGGDSSGICAEPLTRARRDQLNAFYLKSGRTQYTRNASLLDMTRGIGGAKCPCCEIDMINAGGGPDVAFLYCDGCGKKLKKHRIGKYEWLSRHDDFFTQKAATP